ncbi:MAG TPA: hypothetical protein VJ924_13525 [Alphaproteobacteria bacterium]|nr:hypothetical protein [Alphaproteobacteria bacterium]
MALTIAGQTAKNGEQYRREAAGKPRPMTVIRYVERGAFALRRAAGRDGF